MLYIVKYINVIEKYNYVDTVLKSKYIFIKNKKHLTLFIREGKLLFEVYPV